MKRHQLPMVVLFFVVGIGIADGIELKYALGVSLLCVLITIGIFSFPLKTRWKIYGLCLSLGICVSLQHRNNRPSDFGAISINDRAIDKIEGVITGPFEYRSYHVVFSVSLENELVIRVRYYYDSSQSFDFLPGDYVIVYGRVMTPRGYLIPGRISEAERLAKQGLYVVMTSMSIEKYNTSFSMWRFPMWLQRQLSNTMVQQLGDNDRSGILRSMTFGDRSSLKGSTKDILYQSGIGHVVAVSGLHLASTALFVFFVTRKLWSFVDWLSLRIEPNHVACIICGSTAVLYTLITGARVSTIRALIIVLVMLMGLWMQRRSRLSCSLSFAALLILLCSTQTLFEGSFLFSFAAVITLICIPSQHHKSNFNDAQQHRMFKRIKQRMVVLIIASAWITLALMPISAMLFGTIQLGGVLANPLVIPLVEFIALPLGLLGTLFMFVEPHFGGLLLDVSGFSVSVMNTIASWITTLEWSWDFAPITFWEAFVFLLGILGVFFSIKINRLYIKTGVIITIVFSLICFGVEINKRHVDPEANLRVTFLDVGHGDATVLELPHGTTWLIDSGGLPFVVDRGRSKQEKDRYAETPGIRAVVAYLKYRHIQNIDLVVVSHPHPDHFRGLRAVARYATINKLWVAAPCTDSRWSYEFNALIQMMKKQGTTIIFPTLNDSYEMDNVVIKALAPVYEKNYAACDPVSSINDNSLVVDVTYAGKHILFTGDIEEEGEELLFQHHRTLDVDIVKVPHHGSKTSSTSKFVSWLKPQFAVISCGLANRFGFPNQAVLERWTRVGTTIYRTDLHGSVTSMIDSDGTISMKTFFEYR